MSEVNCPYCHRPSLEDISFDELSPPQSGFIDKIDELHHKIRQLDDTIAQLSKNRAELLERLNEAQSSISVLAQEVLSRIFQFASSPPGFGNFFSKANCKFTDASWGDDNSSVERAQVLGKISANWRRIVMTTPQVWTSLTLRIKNSASESDIYFLHQFLEYSGHLPLTLSIHFTKYGFPDNVLVHPYVDALLVKNLWRMKNLELNSPPQVWYSHLPQLGQLARLLLFNLCLPPPEASLTHLSSLSELTLAGFPITFSSPYITTLNLYRVLPGTIFRTLTNCPNLVRLYIWISNPNVTHDEGGSRPVKLFTLQRLEVLEWTIWKDPWEIPLLNHLHLPSLQSLSFIRSSTHHGFAELQEAATNFFARLPVTLTSLEICGVLQDAILRTTKIDFLTLINNLRGDSQIESLALVNCHFSLAAGIFRGLARPQHLPQLSRITLDHIWWDRERITPVLRAFLEAMEKRVGVCERPISLYFTQCDRRVEVEWFDCIRSELEELKQRGGEVKVFFESRLVI